MNKQAVGTIRTLIAAAMATAGAAWADTTTMETSDGQTMIYEYEGDNLRIDMGEQNTYLLVVDGTVYSVTLNDGQYMVIDVSQAMSMFGGALSSAAPGVADSQVESFEATGREETIAGIVGEVYEVEYIDNNGKSQKSDMVLSEDPRTLGLRDALYELASSITKSMGEEVDARKLQFQLLERDMGVLRYGQDMTVTEIDTSEVSPSRFVLPAQPMDMSALGGIMSGAKESGGGIMGGLFGSKDAKKKTDDKDEEATGSAAEEMGKAFGKLFGN